MKRTLASLALVSSFLAPLMFLSAPASAETFPRTVLVEKFGYAQ